MKELIPKEMIEKIELAKEAGVGSIHEDTIYKGRYHYQKYEDDLGVIITFEKKEGEIKKFYICLRNRKKYKTIQISKDVEDPNTPIEWKMEGSWVGYTEKMMNDLHDLTKEELNIFDVKFRIPSVV